MQSLVLAALLLASYVAPNPPLSRHDVAIAGDAHHTLVAWTQIDDGTARIHVLLLGAAKDVVMPLSGQLQIAPAIAFDGTNFLVVWEEIDFRKATARAMRISASGELLDATPMMLGDYTNGLPPRVAWSAGQYRVSAGTTVASINAAGVRSLVPMPATIDTALDLALPDDTTVFARFTPPICHGFSLLFCTPGQNLLTFQPGGDVTLFTKPVWIEAADDIVIWSDGTMLNATRRGVTTLITRGASNATIAGSLVVYEKNERLYAIDLDTNKETVLAEQGSIAPALLARGDGRFTLLYRTTSRPASLKTLELGVESPARRRSF